jgi:hypothetical protein
MPKRVFISYRRSDEPFVAQLIYFMLLEALPRGSVFIDVERLAPGRSFDTQLMSAVANSDVLLVVIGPKWLRNSTPGTMRLDDPNDYVRREISVALQANKEVIPLLLEGAELPPISSLPVDLASLPAMQGVRLRTDRFKADFLELCVRAGIVTEDDLRKKDQASDVALKAQRRIVSKYAEVSTILNSLLMTSGTALAAFEVWKSVSTGTDSHPGITDWTLPARQGSQGYDVSESGWKNR